MPRDERREGAVHVDEAAQPGGRLVGDAVGVAVEARRGDADERVPAILRAGGGDDPEIHGLRVSGGDHRGRTIGIVRDAQHPREVVAAPARDHAEDRAGHLHEAVGEHADHAVAAERDDRLTALRSVDRELAGVVEVARVHATQHQTLRAQRALDVRRDTAGAAAAGGWVHDEADRC